MRFREALVFWITGAALACIIYVSAKLAYEDGVEAGTKTCEIHYQT
jgi:hypothetical protein